MNRQERRRLAKLGTAMNRMARSKCSDCGSATLRWCAPGDLPFLVHLDQQQEAVTFITENQVTECWVCFDCGNYGGFGGWQAG